MEPVQASLQAKLHASPPQHQCQSQKPHATSPGISSAACFLSLLPPSVRCEVMIPLSSSCSCSPNPSPCLLLPLIIPLCCSHHPVIRTSLYPIISYPTWPQLPSVRVFCWCMPILRCHRPIYAIPIHHSLHSSLHKTRNKNAGYDPSATPNSNNSLTNLVCNSIKKSGRPTNSASPLGFSATPPPPNPPPPPTRRSSPPDPAMRKLLPPLDATGAGAGASCCV